jgi:polysaccharide pyruvyl transferase WcaK-like protein
LSNIKLFKNALKKDFNNSFGSSNNNEKLQLLLNEEVASDNYSKLSDRLTEYNQTKEVHIIDFIIRSDFDINELVKLLIQKLPNLKRLNIVLENLWNRESLSNYISSIKTVNGTQVELIFTILFKEKIKAEKQFSNLLKEGINKDLKKVIANNISLQGLFILNPENCLFADDMLLFCQVIGINQFLFMPSSQFKPLDYNNSDRFHTAQFFKKLAKFNSPDFAFSRFYENLFLAYSNLGDEAGLKIKKVIKSIDQNGKQIEGPDYDLDLIPSLGVSDFAQRGFKKVSGIIRNKITPTKKHSFDSGKISAPQISNPKSWKQVLITGWYGTETAGDKAILGEVLHFIKSCSPDCKIILTTIFDHISLQTNLELDDLKNVQLVDIKEAHLPAWVEKADAVIMGGGPLMESQSMIDVWRIFKEANRQEKARIVFGCGVGPIHTPEIEEVTIAILQMTTAGFVRDEESYHYAGRLFKDHVLKFACDPAVGFIHRWRKERLAIGHNGTTNRIAGLVRENTNEFVPNQSKSALFDFNTTIAKKLAAILEPACSNNQLQADLLHMNAPWIGGDDRIFNRILEQTFTDPSLIRTERKYLTLEELIGTLYTAKASMAMRYHGHIFSMALGVPFLSIDYTGKQGKVQSLVERIGYDQWSEKWENINPDRATKRLNTLIDERAHWSNYLLTQTDNLVNLLHNTYEEVFHIEVNEFSK